MKDLESIYANHANANTNNIYLITINISQQILILYKNNKQIKNYKVSSSKFGEGQICLLYTSPSPRD